MLDAHEKRVDRALGDLGEALLSQVGRDLVAVGRALREVREDDPLQTPLSISVSCFPIVSLQLLNNTDYCYIVTLNSEGARAETRRGIRVRHVGSLWVVPVVGLEPTRPHGQSILSAPRLPFRHTAEKRHYPTRSRCVVSDPLGLTGD